MPKRFMTSIAAWMFIFIPGRAAMVKAASLLMPRGKEVSVHLTLGRPGIRISPDFSGLSFEMKDVLPGRDGRHLFSVRNKPVITLFRTLGIGCLRVGGNTADLADVPLPATADIRSLFNFARAAHVHVIYTLRLRGPLHPRRAARTAAYIMHRFADLLTGFALGNEPNLYDRRFSVYQRIWRTYESAVIKASPAARFTGPGSTGSGRWAVDFLHAFGTDRHVCMLTQHTYVGGSAWKVKTPAAGRGFLLSSAIDKQYRRFNRDFGRLAMQHHIPFRMEETNSYYNGGAANVSDTFASALWGLDYMWWWAAHGARGLNFQTGNWVAAGPHLTRCRYAAFWTTRQGLNVHPLGYAMEAFNQAGHGRYIPIHIAAAFHKYLRVYGALAHDGSIFVTLINRSHGNNVRDARVTLSAPHQWMGAREMMLIAPDSSVAAKTGITLGGAAFKPDGTWSGRWSRLPLTASHQLAPVRVPAAAAIILELNPAPGRVAAQRLTRPAP